MLIFVKGDRDLDVEIQFSQPHQLERAVLTPVYPSVGKGCPYSSVCFWHFVDIQVAVAT